MKFFLFVLFMGFVNRFRGSGWVSGGRWIASGAAGVASGLYQFLQHGYDWKVYGVGTIVGVGFYLGSVFGWGKYFSSFSGSGNKDETELAWAEWIAGKLQPRLQTEANWRRYGVICFTLRALLYLPCFIGLALVTHNWWTLLTSLSVLSMGLIYGSMRYLYKKYEVDVVAIAEVLFGLLLGLNIVIAIG